MQEQVVQSRDGVEENALDRRGQKFHQSRDAARLEDGQQTLKEVIIE